VDLRERATQPQGLDESLAEVTLDGRDQETHGVGPFYTPHPVCAELQSNCGATLPAIRQGEEERIIMIRSVLQNDRAGRSLSQWVQSSTLRRGPVVCCSPHSSPSHPPKSVRVVPG
jgi:hypothetical protein